MGICYSDIKGLNEPLVEQKHPPIEPLYPTVNFVTLAPKVSTEGEMKKFYLIPQFLIEDNCDESERETMQIKAIKTITYYNPDTEKVWFEIFEYEIGEGYTGLIIVNDQSEFLFSLKRNRLDLSMNKQDALKQEAKCYIYKDFYSETHDVFGSIGRDPGNNNNYLDNKHYLMIDGRTIYEFLAEGDCVKFAVGSNY
eukprot:48724_1